MKHRASSAAIAATLALIGLATLPAPTRAQAPSVVKIGVTAPLSGPGAQSGLALRTGMQLAVDQINRSGGVKVDGKALKVEAIFEDDQSNPASGVSAALKLITQDKVDFLIGDAFRSDVTLAVMDLAPQFNIPIMSGEPVAAAISHKVAADPKKYANFWKGDLSSNSYASSMFNAVMDFIKAGEIHPSSKTVAFISEDTEYGRSIAALTGQAFEKAGWKVVDSETIPLGASDFYPQYNKLKGLDPAMIMGTFTSADSGAAYVKQFHELGLKSILTGIYFPNRPEFYSGAGKNANELTWATLLFDPVHNKQDREFSALVEREMHRKASYDIAAGYDTMNVAIRAIELAGSVDVKKIDAAMLKLDYDGLQGHIAFDPANHTVREGTDYMIWPVAEIINGESYVVWPKKLATHAFVPQPWLSK